MLVALYIIGVALALGMTIGLSNILEVKYSKIQYTKCLLSWGYVGYEFALIVLSILMGLREVNKNMGKLLNK